MSRAAQRDVGMLWQSAQKEKHHDWPISIIVFVPFYMEQFFVWQYASIHVGFCSDSLPEISHPPSLLSQLEDSNMFFVLLIKQRNVYRRAYFERPIVDRKSTRLNSSHQIISYAVF